MITVRKAILQDSRSVSEFLKEKYSFATLSEARKVFCTEFKRHQHFRLAIDDGRIVGLISWRPQGTVRHGVAELTRLAVVTDCPDPVKIKESLYDVMIAEADLYYRRHDSRLRKVFSMIHADARHIKQFFLDKGMQQEALLKSHFHPGKDELVFSLFLA